MPRPRGGYIGFNRVPAASAANSAASGIWTLREAEALKRAGTWPFPTPPVEASLLLNFNGDNNSTTFTDSSVNGLTVTANGDAKISTAESKFGGASGLFDGDGDYVSVASVPNIGTDDFTIEFWMRVSDVSAYQHVIGTGDQGHLMVALLAPFFGAGAIGVGRDNVAWDFVRNASLSDNTWHHCAITRASGTMRLFVDGAQVGSSGSISESYSLGTVTIGSHVNGTVGSTNGYIDDLRIVKGTAIYTANFTPPTAELGPTV